MGRLACIIWVGLQWNHKHSYKRKAEGDLATEEEMRQWKQEVWEKQDIGVIWERGERDH